MKVVYTDVDLMGFTSYKIFRCSKCGTEVMKPPGVNKVDCSRCKHLEKDEKDES